MYRRSAFDDLFNVFRDFDSLFRRTFSDIASPQLQSERLLPSTESSGAALAPSEAYPALSGWGRYPAVDSFTKDGKLFIRAEMPGVEPSDVQVTVTGNRLQITGEKKASREMNEANVHYREISLGRFERSFLLPENIKGDDVKARFENGVLELSMPAPEEARSRKVSIEVAAPSGKQVKAA